VITPPSSLLRDGTSGRPLGGEDVTRYLATLLRLAAVDGIADEEVAVVRDIARQLGVADADVERARSLAAGLEPTESLLRTIVEPVQRIALLRDAYRVATADDVVTAREVEELHALSQRLGVGDLAEQAIRQVVEADRARTRAMEPTPPLPAKPPSPARPGDLRIVEEIAAALDVDAVARAAERARAYVCALLEQGTAASQVTRAFSELNDRLAIRILDLVLGAEAVPGLTLCWISLGSEGRGEQTLHTDQDNAIVFEAPGLEPDEARERLLPVARRVNEALAACGFTRCAGGIMAGQATCCASSAEWGARFDDWMDVPDPEALLRATIFFDLRPLWGDFALGNRLRDRLARRAPGQSRFLAQLTEHALSRHPPLGLFRDFAVEPSGPHAGTLDLKLGAVTPFVDAARVLALAAGVAEPGTAARLRGAGPRAGIEAEDVDAAVEAFDFVQGLRLRLQDELRRSGKPLHNHLDPSRLNPLERRFLREALRQARSLQDALGRASALAAASL